MTDLEFLCGRIGGYAGYRDDDSRHQADKQMRAWLARRSPSSATACTPPDMRAAASPEALAAELDTAARCLDERFGALADAPASQLAQALS